MNAKALYELSNVSVPKRESTTIKEQQQQLENEHDECECEYGATHFAFFATKLLYTLHFISYRLAGAFYFIFILYLLGSIYCVTLDGADFL